MKLKNPALFRQQSYINGQWLDADNKEVVDVTNPANGEVLGSIAKMSTSETEMAIAAANEALPLWQKKAAKERANIMRKWFDLIIENKDDLAAIMTAEQGKPFTEAQGEVVYGASFIEWFAEEAKRIYGDTIPGHMENKRIVVLKQGIGVVAAITPWNFPNAMITRKAGPALAAGCTFIVKPATETPYSALALAELADQAGIPKGVFNVITGKSREIGAALTSSSIVRKLSFTGSTEIGKVLIKQCADTVKKVSMELGGNAPFIVFDDADIPNAVLGAIASKYRNSGQTCVCANRLYIQDGVYDEFAKQFAAAVNKINVGDGMGEGITMGPLINAGAVDKVNEHIDDAVAKGAEILTGGKSHALGGLFFEPTVLKNVSNDMLITHEETFGPVAPLVKFSSEEEVIRLANDTPFGLAAYFYSTNLSRVWRVSEALETGIVGINTGIISTEVAPFGGVKESGMGREGSKYGIEDYLEIKYLCMEI